MDILCKVTHAFPSRKTSAFLIHMHLLSIVKVGPVVHIVNFPRKESLQGPLISLTYSRQSRSAEADELSKEKSIVLNFYACIIFFQAGKWGKDAALEREIICLLLIHGMKSRVVPGHAQNLPPSHTSWHRLKAGISLQYT